jgi:hypothetical protein
MGPPATHVRVNPLQSWSVDREDVGGISSPIAALLIQRSGGQRVKREPMILEIGPSCPPSRASWFRVTLHRKSEWHPIRIQFWNV